MQTKVVRMEISLGGAKRKKNYVRVDRRIERATESLDK